MATYRQLGKKVHAQVRLEKHCLSKTFDTMREAQLWACTKELEILQGGFGDDRSMADLLKMYGEKFSPMKRGYEHELRLISQISRQSWAKKPIYKLTYEELTDYRDYRLKTIKPITFKREWAFIKAVLNKADAFGLKIDDKIFKQMTWPRILGNRPRRIKPEQVETLLRFCNHERTRNNYMHPVIRLGLSTAMRRGEMLALRWDDVDFQNFRINLRAEITKSGYAREIPITQDCESALYDLRELALKGEHPEMVVSCSPNAIKKSWQRLQHISGLKSVRFHDLRHEAISRLHELGLTLPEIQSISGHRELSMLEVYSHAEVDNLTSKLRRLNDVGGRNVY